MKVFIGLLVVLLLIVLSVAFPYVGLPIIVILVFNMGFNKRKKKSADTQVDTTSKSSDGVRVTSVFRVKSDYSDYSRFFQKWDESYSNDLGYEWFRVCVERDRFPIYNAVCIRLRNVRNSWGYTQVEAAKRSNISTSTLSSYENGYTVPSSDIFKALAACYCVPLAFIKCGYVDDLAEHVKLCERYGEEEYLHSLYLSAKAASNLFPEMLTPDDKAICIFINDILDMKLDLFNEHSKAVEELRNTIKADIVSKLNCTDVVQRDLYLSYGDNRTIAQNIVKELYDNGVISKEKQGNTFILHLVEETAAVVN